MSIYNSLTELEEDIADYRAAFKKVSKGQDVWIDGQRMTRADLPEIRKTLDWLDKEKSRLLGKRAAVIVVGRVAR